MTTSTGSVQRNKELFGQGLKECCDCGVVKELSDFTPIARAVKPGVSSVTAACKVCRNARNAEWRAKNPEHAKRTAKFGNLLRTYGVTMEQWNALFESQKGCCAICRAHASELKKGLVVDHNHETGAVRALLCPPCNTGVGMFAEDPSVLAAAIEYLRAHNGKAV